MNVLSLTLLMTTLAAAPQAEVRTLGGASQTGTLKELSAERLVLTTDSGEQTFATKELLGVSLRGEPARLARPQTWVELIDRTRLTGQDYLASEGRARIKFADGQEVAIPTASVVSVRLKEQSEAIARQWSDIVSMKQAADVIIVRREEAIDFLEGVLGDVTAEAVQFKVDGDVVNVKRPRVEGFLYFRPQAAELPLPACEVLTHDGGRLPAKQLQLKDNQLVIVTPSGLELMRPLEAFKELDFSLGKLRYLSDLEWESVERQDYLALSDARPDRFYEPRKDSSFLGPLRLAGKTYARGLAIKSQTKLTYRLPGKFSRLVGLAGINGNVAPGGHVRLTIRGDQQSEPLLETTISGADAPQELSLDLAGVRRLTIEVGFGDGGDTGDHLNLCDVRIIQ